MHRATPRRLSALTGTLFGAMLLAACGGSAGIDTAKISAELGTQAGITVTSLNCPPPPAHVGDSVTCVGTRQTGGAFSVSVTQSTDSSYSWKLQTSLFLDIAALQSQVMDGLTQQGYAIASVDCPTAQRPTLKGDAFRCTVNAEDGTSATLLVTQTDDEGNVSYKFS